MEWYEIPQVRETLEGFTQYMLREQRGRLSLEEPPEVEPQKQVFLDSDKVIRVAPEV